jgi:DNA-binding NarL/FixJ family response regulator
VKPRRNGISARKRAILGADLTLHSTEQSSPTDTRRKIMADFCRTIGVTIRGETPSQPDPTPMPNLSPRMKQTLQRLLAGDSEKQIAGHLGLSPHTVHVYVKALYKGFNVASRGELLARFVRLPRFAGQDRLPQRTSAHHGGT